VGSELVVVVVVEALDGRLFDRAIPLAGKRLLANAEKHSLDLAIRPRVLHLCQPVLDLMVLADAVKDVFEGTRIAASICELDTVVSQYRVQPVRNGSDHRLRRGPRPAGPGSGGVEPGAFGHACSSAGVPPEAAEGGVDHVEAASTGGTRRPVIWPGTPAKTSRGSAASANWKTA
jgi:hypothetical protein